MFTSAPTSFTVPVSPGNGMVARSSTPPHGITTKLMSDGIARSAGAAVNSARSTWLGV